MSPDLLSTEQIKAYLYHCKVKRGLSTSTINAIISAIKLLHCDVLGRVWNKDIKIKRPRRESPLPDILSRHEVTQMLGVTRNLKHKLIIAILYSSGIRNNELLNLKIKDIDSQRMLIRVELGKGKKSRDTILANKTLNILRDYFTTSYPKPQKYIIETPSVSGEKYSATSVLNVVKKAASLAGITKNVSPHTLRHSFATHLLEDGVNLMLIQQLLGHSNLNTTMVYLHLATNDSTVASPFDLIESQS